MSLQHFDGHRHLPVRLCDLNAALCPSDHVFYVHASAAPILRQAAA